MYFSSKSKTRKDCSYSKGNVAYYTILSVDYSEDWCSRTSAHDKNILASACLIDFDMHLVSPKSRRIGLCGGSLLTRKLPTERKRPCKYELMCKDTTGKDDRNLPKTHMITRVRVTVKEAINVYLMSVCTGYLFNKFLLINTISFQWIIVI